MTLKAKELILLDLFTFDLTIDLTIAALHSYRSFRVSFSFSFNYLITFPTRICITFFSDFRLWNTFSRQGLIEKKG